MSEMMSVNHLKIRQVHGVKDEKTGHKLIIC